jgi:hypothetical protein
VTAAPAPAATEREIDFSDVLAGASGAPAPSVLPEEGINLVAELERYKLWMIEQALIRTNGNQSEAGRLLGYPNNGRALWLFLHSRKTGRLPAGMTKRARRAPGTEQPAPPPPRPTPAPPAKLDPVEAVARRIDWAWVAQLRAQRLSDRNIAQKIAPSLGVHKVYVEKALGRPRPLAKCEP